MATRTPITDELREALRRCETSRYKLWQETGISQSTLSKFLSGASNLSMETADVLAERLGVRLAPETPTKTKTPKRRATKKRGS